MKLNMFYKMNMNLCLANILITVLLFNKVDAFQKTLFLTLEKATVKLLDKTSVANATCTVAKISRNSTPSLSCNMYLLKPWMDNVTVQFIAYQFRNNMYKESFIQTKISICVLLKDDKWLTPLARKYGNAPKSCPFPAGYSYVKNLKLLSEYFPVNFPEFKWRFDLNIIHTKMLNPILQMSIYFKAERRNFLKTIKNAH